MVFLLALLLWGPLAPAVGASQESSANVRATSVAQTDRACESCHGDIYRQYLSTPMANASGAAVDKLVPIQFENPKSHVEYDVSLEKGSKDSALLTIKAPDNPGETTQRRLSYFLGSGHLAVSYLYSVNGFLFESPVAWFPAAKGYDMKPGLEQLTHIAPAIPMQSSCLRCHMSAVQPSEAGSLNAYKGLPFLHTGITCEACHGESTEHVASKGKTTIVNPANLSAERRDSVCISCHLEGDVSVERAGKSALQYRPGELMSTYVAYYVLGGAELTKRGVSEVEQFAQSRCKLASGDAMSCMNCHDPHTSPLAAQKTAFYREKCLACHADGVRGGQPEFARQHHPEQQDCTSCHMPRTGAENIQHAAWTDHRILKVPDSMQERPVLNAELTPIFSPGASKRDLAMAYFKGMLDGNRKLEPKAWQLLNEQRDAVQNDKEALDALGVLNLQRGQAETAEEYFRRALELDSSDVVALTNLGTLLAKKGDAKSAAPLLKSAFERNPDVAGLAMNLARVACMTGDAAAAREALDTTLLYNPGVASVKRLRFQLENCKSDGAAVAKQ